MLISAVVVIQAFSMKSTGKRGAGKCLNDIERLEIISKLQQSNPLSKRAMVRKYNIGESAIRKLWNQRESVFQQTQDIPVSSQAYVFCRTQAWFPELEDHLHIWIDTMRRLKAGTSSDIGYRKGSRDFQYFEYCRGRF